MEATITPSASTRTVDARLWTARVLGALVILFLLFDAVGKLLRLGPVVEGSARVGFAAGTLVPLGVVLLVSTVLYAVRRTAVLGAILLTAWLGGAVATHVRMGEPFIVWGCLYLRDARLRALLAPVGR